jgi:hypothetical protein
VIHTPRTGQMFFLPQQPFMPLGTLRQQLLFPSGALNHPRVRLRIRTLPPAAVVWLSRACTPSMHCRSSTPRVPRRLCFRTTADAQQGPRVHEG